MDSIHENTIQRNANLSPVSRFNIFIAQPAIKWPDFRLFPVAQVTSTDYYNKSNIYET